MAFYRGGTIGIAAGSRTVTGTATVFMAQVKPGDTLMIGATIGLIESVESNTAATLALPWAGATVAGVAAYVVAHTGEGWSSTRTASETILQLVTKIDQFQQTVSAKNAIDIIFTATGGLAANTVQAALAELDAEKLAAAALEAAIAGLAPIDTPVLTGMPRAPTPTTGDASTRIATTAFVAAAIGSGGGSGGGSGAYVPLTAKATQGQALAGVADDLWMTPLRTRQLVDAEIAAAGGSGGGTGGGSGGGSAFVIGDILLTARQPGGLWLPADGASYVKTDWPDLAALLGAIPNGLDTWTAGSVDQASASIFAAAYGLGNYVVCTSTGVWYTSPDGVTWTVFYNGGTPYSSNRLVFGPGRLVALRSSSGNLLTSTDLAGLASQPTPMAGFGAYDLIYAGGRYVAVGEEERIVTSADGVTWTLGHANSANANSHNGILTAVAYGNGTFVASRDSGIVLTSNNGTSWTQHTAGETGLPGQVASWMIFAFNKFIGCFPGGGVPNLYTSTDGIAWTAHPGVFVPAGRPIMTLTYLLAPDRYDGGLYTSLDGLVWQRHQTTISGGGVLAANGNGLLMGGADLTTSRASIYLYDHGAEFIVPTHPSYEDALIPYIKAG